MSIEVFTRSKFKSARSKSKDEKKPSARKTGRSHKCRVCSTKTFQQDNLCVLCKTGIREQYENMIASLK